MLANKRTQIRNNIRKSELLQHFALRRMELVQGKHGLVSELYQQLENQIGGQTNIQLIGKLLAYHKQNPLQQNTYVLISNYIFEQPQDLRYFYHTIVGEPRCLEHYMWCLLVIAMTLNINLQMNEKVQMFTLREQMLQLIESTNNVIVKVLTNLKSNNQKSNKEINMWSYYMQIVKLVLESQVLEEFPRFILETFVEGASLFNINQTQFNLLIPFWRCMTTIIKQHCKRLQNRLRQNIMKECASLSYLMLKETTIQIKMQCIQLLHTIISEFPIDFMFLIYSQNLMKQILYLLREMPSLKSSSTRLIKLIVQQCNLPELLIMLQLQAHNILTQTMEWSINAGNNICLEDCLIVLYNILNALNMSGEKRLLQRVQSQMQYVNFDKMIEGLSQNSQTQKIWRYLSFIIDDFYSEEGC